MMSGIKTTNLEGRELNDQMRFVDQYCDQRPLATYAQAVMSLYDTMRSEQGLHDWRGTPKYGRRYSNWRCEGCRNVRRSTELSSAFHPRPLFRRGATVGRSGRLGPPALRDLTDGRSPLPAALD
jgi:hypothetical protein